MSSALLFMLVLSGLGIGGNIFSDAAACLPDICIPPRQRCPFGWTLYDERCYVFKETATTWADAEDQCKGSDAHLTSIQDPDQYNFIRDLIRRATGTDTRTWVGGTNSGQDEQWRWVDGSPFTFTNWGPGEPNNAGGNEHCMDINLRGMDYVNDESCDTKSAFVCAKDA